MRFSVISSLKRGLPHERLLVYTAIIHQVKCPQSEGLVTFAILFFAFNILEYVLT